MSYQNEVDRDIPGETWQGRFARLERAYDVEFGDEGFIYAVQTPEPAIKIGKSIDPKRVRLPSVQGFFVARLKLLAMWHTDEKHEDEARAHQECKRLHLRGELFKNEPEAILSILNAMFGEPEPMNDDSGGAS